MQKIWTDTKPFIHALLTCLSITDIIAVQCALCLPHTHTALNRSGTWRTGRGPETAGLHVRRRDVAAAGITPDCIQSLYLSLAKTAHYTPNHSTPIHPHDLERVRGALRICYCVNPKDLKFALGFQMHHDWNVTSTMGFAASTEKKKKKVPEYEWKSIHYVDNEYFSYSFWGVSTNLWECTRVQVFRFCLVGLDQYQNFCFCTIPSSGTAVSILNQYLMKNLGLLMK